MTKGECAKIVAVLASAYPNATLSEQTVQVYESSLGDVEFDAAARAVQRLVNTSRFMPTVAEIREVCHAFAAGSKRLGAEAWGDVLGQIRFEGSYGIPRFNDPLTAECVRILGWRNLCLSENDAADRARFIELYENLREREERNAVAGPGLALPEPQANHAQRVLADLGRMAFRRLTEPKRLTRGEIEQQKAEMARLDSPSDARAHPPDAPVETRAGAGPRELKASIGKAMP